MATYEEVSEALRMAVQSGNGQLANALADKIEKKDYEESTSGVQSAAIGVGQGLTFGFGDEISAGIRAGLGGFFEEEGRSLGERYSSALEGTRGRLEAARREDPWLTGIGEVAGGIALGGAGASRAIGTQAARQLAGRTLGQGIRRAGAVGAGMGALAGWGYSDSDPIATGLAEVMQPGEMTEEQFGNVHKELTGVAGDVAIGAGLGATLGSAIPAVGAAARMVGRTFMRPFTRNKQLREEARREIVQAIEEDVQTRGISIEQLRGEMKEFGLGIMDVGPATRQVAERVSQTSTAGGRLLRETLAKRNVEQIDRMMPKLAQYLAPDAPETSLGLAQLKMRLLKTRRSEADELYGAVKDQVMPLSPQMRAFMALKESRTPLSSANSIRRAGSLPALPDMKKVSSMTVDEIDSFVQGWDQKLNRMWKRKPKEAAAWKERFSKFKEALYTQNDDYRQARTAWSNNMRLEEAVESGENFFKMDADLIPQMLQDMTEAEQSHFRIGALRQLTRLMEGTPNEGDVIKRIVSKRKSERSLQAVFGDETNFNQFMRYVEGERAKFETFKAANLNSASIKRLMQQMNDPVEDLAGLMTTAAALKAGGGLAMMGLSRRLGTSALRGMRGFKPDEAAIFRNNVQGGMLTQGAEGVADLMQPYTMKGLLNTDIPMATPWVVGGATASGALAPNGLLSQ